MGTTLRKVVDVRLTQGAPASLSQSRSLHGAAQGLSLDETTAAEMIKLWRRLTTKGDTLFGR